MQAQVTNIQDAIQKARYGHRDWIAYTDKVGIRRYERATAETIKQAMLSHGTKGSFTLINANCGTLMKMSWWIANNVRRQCLMGWR